MPKQNGNNLPLEVSNNDDTRKAETKWSVSLLLRARHHPPEKMKKKERKSSQWARQEYTLTHMHTHTQNNGKSQAKWKIISRARKLKTNFGYLVIDILFLIHAQNNADENMPIIEQLSSKHRATERKASEREISYRIWNWSGNNERINSSNHHNFQLQIAPMKW